MERFELENSREFKAAMELENALKDIAIGIQKALTGEDNGFSWFLS